MKLLIGRRSIAAAPDATLTPETASPRQLGCITEGAHADLIVVDGDPLADIGLVAADGAKLSVIVRGDEVVKDVLT